MKQILKQINYVFSLIGAYPLAVFDVFRKLYLYYSDLWVINKQLSKNSDFKVMNLKLMLHDKYAYSGTMRGHYFHQDLLVAKMIFKNSPEKHVDVGSRTDGFVAHVASFREIEVFDIRPQHSTVNNITFVQIDLMADFPLNMIEHYDSVSSLHAIEHFGLGRYGDRIDSEGHLKALDNIYKILKKRGKFYFSVPIGEQKIIFNAHRIFCMKYLIGILNNKYRIDTFSFVNDNGELLENVQLDEVNINNNFGCHYGLGIFELTKL